MHPHDGKNVFVVRTHRSPSDTHSLSLSSLLQSWHGVSLSLPSLPSSVPAATCREPSDPCNTLSSATSSLVPLSYLPRREERSREQIAGAACEGVGMAFRGKLSHNTQITGNPEAPFPHPPPLRGAVWQRQDLRLGLEHIRKSRMSVKAQTAWHFESTRKRIISAPFPSFSRHLSIHRRHDCF